MPEHRRAGGPAAFALRVEEHDVVRVYEVHCEEPRLARRAARREALEQVDRLRGGYAVVAEAGPCEAGVLAVVVVVGEAVVLERVRRVGKLAHADLLVDDAQVPLALVGGVVALRAQHRADRRESRGQLHAKAARPLRRIRSVLADGVRVHAGLLNVLAGVESRARRPAGRLVHVIVAERAALVQQAAQRRQRQLVGPIGPRAQLVHADEENVRSSVAPLRAHAAAAQARHRGAEQRCAGSGRRAAQELRSRDLRIAHGFSAAGCVAGAIAGAVCVAGARAGAGAPSV